MDRRIHNAIKLSAAVFLLNACGFAVKEKSATEQPQATASSTDFVVGQAPRGCYKQVNKKSDLQSIDENGDLFSYNSPQTQGFRSDQVVMSETSEVVADGSCI
jgi:hypothetical protein